jgi:radical SAM superfamily enzyme
MIAEPYDIGPIRPPSEAGSLLIRVSRNCPWNKCEFCPVYKGEKFEKKSAAEVKRDIDRAADFYGNRARLVRTAFLQDANAILMKTEDLVGVIRHLGEKFPNLERITTYGRAQTVAKKTVSELAQLREAGLTRLHIGMESGSAAVLDSIKKGATPGQIVEAGRKAREAGIQISEYYMPGLGGKALSREHAAESARVLNAIDPDFIRLRSTTVRPGTPLYEKFKRGEFTPLTDFEMVEEISLFIENLDGITSAVVSDHIMNLLQEVEGELPGDKPKMLAALDRFTGLPEEDKRLFQVGARLGWMRRPDDLNDDGTRLRAREIVGRIEDEIAARGGGMTVDDFIREVMKDYI